MGVTLVNGVPIESSGAVPVALQDQHSEMIIAPLYVQSNSGELLASAVVVDDTTLTLDAGHGTGVGDVVCLKEGAHYYTGRVLDFAGGANVPTMDTPLDHAYAIDAGVCIGDANLNVNGSLATPIVAQVSPPPGVQWDITRMHIRMVDNAVMDAGTFGGIPALTNGVVLRRADGVSKNIGNVKTNGDLALLASSYSFDDKPPSGKYGFTSNHVFGGQEHVGVTMRLNGSSADEMQVIIQDNLTGNEVLQIVAIGHVVED